MEAQKNYLEKNFPGYQVVSRTTWVFGKKFIDRVRLEKEDDTRVLMFDVSVHINEYKKTHEINLKEIAPGMISVQNEFLIVRNYSRLEKYLLRQCLSFIFVYMR